MLRMQKWVAPVAGLALLIGFAQTQSRAADPAPAAKASITVTVVDSDGKPAAGANVTLYAATEHKKRGGKQAPAAPAAADGTTKTKPAREKPESIATGTTDAEGKAVLTGIPDGKYRVNARIKHGGAGHESVTVADGKDVSVSVTLKAKPAKTN